MTLAFSEVENTTHVLMMWTVGMSAPSACLLMTVNKAMCYGQHAGGKGCQLEGLWQAWKLGLCKSHEVQLVHVQGHALGLGQSHAQSQAGAG